MSLYVDGVNGLTFPDGSAQPTSGYTGFRNRIINGAMVIDQRNAGAVISAANLTFGAYTIDRWQYNATQSAKFTAQQNAGSATPPQGFSNYLGLVSQSAYSLTGNDYFSVSQAIEGYNFFDLGFGTANAKTVTVSFWVYSSLTGSFGASLQNYAENRCYSFAYTISSANTWTYITVTIPGDTGGTWVGSSNAGAAYLWFGLGASGTRVGTPGAWGSQAAAGVQPTGTVSVVGTSGATFYITGVQLEKSGTATPFEYRQYGTELALCQRYYQILGNNDSSSNGMSFKGYNAASAYDLFTLSLINQMRQSPTGSTIGTWAVTNCGQPAITGTTATTFSFQVLITALGSYVMTSNNSGYFTFVSEL